MPCACRVPIPDYPSNAAWGPLFWLILHGLAEKAGQGTMFGSGSGADEVREWQRFLKATGETLPCDECRAHFLNYTAANPLILLPPGQESAVVLPLKGAPLTHFAEVPYQSLKTAVKTWLWQLHNDIRVEYGHTPLPFDQLTPLYAGVNLQDLFWRLEPVMKNAINIKGMGGMKWQAWVKSFKMLRAILGV
jgi:hypothetical protein